MIRTELRLGEHTYPIEVTLTNRDSMGYRMLLGREAMLGKLIVDPERKFELGQPSSEELKDFYYKDTEKKD